MSAQAKPAAVDLDAEQEVDFGRYFRVVFTRWWLLILGVVAGAIIGYLATLGSGNNYKATAEIYLGQPLNIGGGAPVTSAPTTIGLVTNLVTSESVIKQVAAQVGLRPAQLRGHITTKPLVGITGAKQGAPAPLLNITVDGRPPAKIAAAANALAKVITTQVAPYSTSKIKTLGDQLAYDQKQLDVLTVRLDLARKNQQQVLSDKSINPTDKLIALGNLNSVITLALQQQNGLTQDSFQVRQQLSLAQSVEASRIVSTAAATKTAAPSKRTGVAIGAVIGLILAIVVALLWEPVARGIRSRPAAAS